MKTALLTGAAMLMAVSSVAFAQTTQVPSGQAPAGVTSSSPDAAKASAMNSTDNARAGRAQSRWRAFIAVTVRPRTGCRGP